MQHVSAKESFILCKICVWSIFEYSHCLWTLWQELIYEWNGNVIGQLKLLSPQIIRWFLTATSSFDGVNFTGAVDILLIIDDYELNYE